MPRASPHNWEEKYTKRPESTSAVRAEHPRARQNEYFVPRDGIDREVITTEICSYLGDDALVRPGTYLDEVNCFNLIHFRLYGGRQTDKQLHHRPAVETFRDITSQRIET